MSECTGVSAAWCPVHGDCTCPQNEGGLAEEQDAECPLHGLASLHAEEAEAAAAEAAEEAFALRLQLSQLRQNLAAPRPWRVVDDWTAEVVAADDTVVDKFPRERRAEAVAMCERANAAAVAAVDATEGGTHRLLETVAAWAAQGARSRWNTGPSLALWDLVTDILAGKVTLGPELRMLPTEGGDYVELCSGCDQEREEPHSWAECTLGLRQEVVRGINADVDMHAPTGELARLRDTVTGIASVYQWTNRRLRAYIQTRHPELVEHDEQGNRIKRG